MNLCVFDKVLDKPLKNNCTRFIDIGLLSALWNVFTEISLHFQ